MKTSMPHLGFILAALAATALAQDAAAPSIAEDNPAAQKPSTGVSQQINAGLPKYSPVKPAEPRADSPIGAPEAVTDPDVLELPKMTVRQKPRPRLTPDLVFTPKDYGDYYARQKFTTLDRALNKFTLPLFGTSLEARAYDEAQRAKKEELNSDVQNLSNALEVVSPAEAKALRDAAAKP